MSTSFNRVLFSHGDWATSWTWGPPRRLWRPQLSAPFGDVCQEKEKGSGSETEQKEKAREAETENGEGDLCRKGAMGREAREKTQKTEGQSGRR